MNYNGKKVAFTTLGCKLNFSETSTIARSFQEMGFDRTGFRDKADVYVINTCSVTDTADKKSRAIIRQAIRQNPAAFVVVVGCYAQLKPDEVAGIDGVDLVLGANDKFNITKYLDGLEKHKKGEVHNCSFTRINKFDHAYSYGDRTRSFLKVQDGCNYFCTYCTIPMARGKSRNPSITSLVEEANRAGEQGIREIILTGVNIGDFGQSTGETFYDLVQALDEVESVDRIRISSIEPNLLNDDIIEFVSRSKRIAPHFHIPLQAGTNEVLKLMARRYDRELFARRVEKIKELLPHAFIGVDVIAGMNGESDKLFDESYRFIEGLDISQLHVFPYSERSKTSALNIEGVVPVPERKRRVEQLKELSNRKLKDFYLKHDGQTHKVLFESSRSKTRITGWTENYIKVETDFRDELINQIREVKLAGINPTGNMAIHVD